MKGKPCIVLKPGVIPAPCSITLLTSLNTEQNFFVDVRHGSNTQADFLQCLKKFHQAGAFLQGDILIMDNAAVHLSEKLGREIMDFCHDIGVAIQTLPTYSPELNPCELVFARIKNFLKSNDNVEMTESGSSRCIPLERSLSIVLQSMRLDDLINLYSHCSKPECR